MLTATLKTALCCLLAPLFLISTPPAWSADKSKDEDVLINAAKVLQAMLHSGAVPSSVLGTANCILILPQVKHFAVGVGRSGGDGPLLCRKGRNFSGREWSAPAMYTIGGATAGLQVGGSSTDFVALILSPSAANKLLAGKIKIGKSDISATLGAATSTGWVADTDIVAFGHGKGLSVGASLKDATLAPDADADQRLYEKAVSPRDIVLEDTVKPTPAGQSLMALLEKVGRS